MLTTFQTDQVTTSKLKLDGFIIRLKQVGNKLVLSLIKICLS